MNMLITKNGISVIEYVLLIIVIAAAVISMQTYIRRAAFGKARTAMDEYVGYNRQFDKNTTATYSRYTAPSSPAAGPESCESRRARLCQNFPTSKCDGQEIPDTYLCCGGCED